jgi:hypothetical protein
VRLDHLLSKESHRVGGIDRLSARSTLVVLISDSTFVERASARRERGWVEHKVNAVPESKSLAHCWVLRRHLVFLLGMAAPGLGRLTHPDLLGGGCGGGRFGLGCGCVLSVA